MNTSGTIHFNVFRAHPHCSTVHFAVPCLPFALELEKGARLSFTSSERTPGKVLRLFPVMSHTSRCSPRAFQPSILVQYTHRASVRLSLETNRRYSGTLHCTYCSCQRALRLTPAGYLCCACLYILKCECLYTLFIKCYTVLHLEGASASVFPYMSLECASTS